MDDEERCEVCRFWDTEGMPVHKLLQFGVCRRYPKQRTAINHEKADTIDDVWAHPPHEADEWCGEFSRKTSAG